ncbi:phosducin-like protein [Condylostylus longicornis]|uniref:phosducin-like protein n=1 Tax=Condylostylus longicornis TaxID=2530218 RepID=UPI00244E473D|nr:phosducin-like protein [Condylostylus longicornis]
MATFDDKLLGEKLQYYVSESESEDEEVIGACSNKPELDQNKTHWSGTSVNTGPKGVVEDWQKFKQMQAEMREENERQKVELAKKLSMTVRTYKEDLKKEEEEELEREMAELMNDDILLQFQKKRMMEILASSGELKQFGKVFEINTTAEFLDCIENESKHVIIIIHVYDRNVATCREVNKCLDVLASEHITTKFCKILCSITGMSHNFRENGLPAILVYKAGAMIGNFVQITKEIGDDIFPSDLENYLIENDVLTEKINR